MITKATGLSGRVAIVTGAGSGIGRAITKAFAEHGVRVCCADIDLQSAVRTADESSASTGSECVGIKVDVTSPLETKEMVDIANDTFGRIDILCANAGIATADTAGGFGTRVCDTQLVDWERMLAVNLTGAFLSIRAVLPTMMEQCYGRIVTTASYLGLVAQRGSAAYCASKFGLVGLTQAVAHEMAPHGIYVNAVAPGDVDTPMMQREWEALATRLQITPTEAMKRFEKRQLFGHLQSPEEIAAAVRFLASDDASGITGEILRVSGGLPLTSVALELIPSDHAAYD